MSTQKEEQLNQKIEEKQQKMLSFLTNENKTDKQIKKQFYFMAQNHEKYPFMEDSDLMLFRSSLKNIQLQNFIVFSISAVSSGVAYKLAGGFTPSEKSPWLRRLRHASVVGIPSVLIPVVYFTLFPGQNQQNIVDLSLKYKTKLLDPEFNKQVSQYYADKYRQQQQKRQKQ